MFVSLFIICRRTTVTHQVIHKSVLYCVCIRALKRVNCIGGVCFCDVFRSWQAFTQMILSLVNNGQACLICGALKVAFAFVKRSIHFIRVIHFSTITFTIKYQQRRYVQLCPLAVKHVSKCSVPFHHCSLDLVDDISPEHTWHTFLQWKDLLFEMKNAVIPCVSKVQYLAPIVWTDWQNWSDPVRCGHKDKFESCNVSWCQENMIPAQNSETYTPHNAVTKFAGQKSIHLWTLQIWQMASVTGVLAFCLLIEHVIGTHKCHL